MSMSIDSGSVPRGLANLTLDKKLCDLCDDVRASLQDNDKMGPRRDEMMQLLGEAVKYECKGIAKFTLLTIKKTHLDKVLADMLVHRPVDGTDATRADTSIAESLQRQWRAKYKDLYISLDNERYRELIDARGRLAGLVFDPDAPSLWVPKRCATLSEVESYDEFCEGQYVW